MKTEESQAKVLIVEDDCGLGRLLQDEVEDAGMAARLSQTAEAALDIARQWGPDVIVSDLRLPGADGLSLMQKIRREIPLGTPDFLIITAFGSVAKAVESLQAGAEDFLTKPLDLDHLRVSIARILEKRSLRQEISRMRSILDADGAFHGMYGRSQCMQHLFKQIRQIAKGGGPVLITGESGTGKELVANAIHREGKPQSHPFLAVNCAGIPEQLLESEFFGYEKGAFTGADSFRQGLFAEADGGTLLLDEISEMPLPLQAKILRMLQDGRIRPVGGNRERQVNVRVVAATNRDIEQLVRMGKFREDLFYRLETFSLAVPPLRERNDDIDLLAGFFLQKHSCATNKKIKGYALRTLRILRNYPFPGNVRELQNAVERAVVFCSGEEILPEHLPPRIVDRVEESQHGLADGGLSDTSINDDSLLTLEEVERRHIQQVLRRVNGNKRLAASVLGIARRTLYRRIDEINAAEG